MAKAKVITALALTVVMLVVMTGLAAADPVLYTCNSDGFDKSSFGPTDPLYVTGSDLGANITGAKIFVVDNTDTYSANVGKPISSFCTVRYTKTNVSTHASGQFIPDPLYVCNIADLEPDIFPWYYDVIFDADGDGIYDGTSEDPVDKIGCYGFEKIPEFTTIAIPVAAILGLLFFYNYRKRKEE